MLVGLNTRVWLGVVPLMLKAFDTPPTVLCEKMLQLRSLPAPAGRGSLNVTPVTVTGPRALDGGPITLMVTVYPAGFGTATVALSAVLVRLPWSTDSGSAPFGLLIALLFVSPL